MKTQQSLEEIITGAIDLWRKEGVDSRDSASAFYNIHNDPVVQLLISAVAHQSFLISADIESFRSDIIDIYKTLASSSANADPTPAVTWAHVRKKTQVGMVNKESSILDETVSFKLQATSDAPHKNYSFIPLISTRIVDAEVVEVTALSSRNLRVDIALNEPLGSLAGISFFSSAILPNTIASVSLDGTQLPIHRLSDLGALPLTKPFATSFDASSDSVQQRMLQSVYDSLCFHMGEFFIIADSWQAEKIQTVDGCISIELEMNDADISLGKDDIFLNTLPLVNVHLCQASLSSEQPLCKVDTGTLKFLSLSATHDSSRVALRRVAAERQTLENWNRSLLHLLEQYEENYNLYNNQMEPHFAATIRQLISTLRELSKQPLSPLPPLYLVLLDKGVSSLSVPYLLTYGAVANKIKINGTMEISSSEYDSAKSRLLTPAFGGSDGNPAQNDYYQNYIMQTGDRIVTKSDIEAFCRYQLFRYFNIPSSALRISISSIINNTANGFYERIIFVEIHSSISIDNPSRVAKTLQLMMLPRTATLTPVKIKIE